MGIEILELGTKNWEHCITINKFKYVNTYTIE